ncbi:phage tail tube protein [Schaalia sp. lx-260]|uniref:phage tail tube protein n=1 Tax=Schaalia sp. lx-260 TaxID=2899082 RepID=UPI001E545F8A|nr:phage tail protein [Schaalia sp. lx-260]MCD4549676.1 phage tail protein [Schaalia sp. lx-260]
MGSPNAKLVSAAKPVASGAIAFAPLGTSIPTDATTDLPIAFKRLGYVSEDGLTNEVEVDTEDVVAWGGDKVLTIRTSRTESLGWTFIQVLDVDVLKAVFGEANVSGTLETGLTILHNNKELPHGVWVVEMAMTGGIIKRLVVPDGQITEVGEISYQDGEPVGLEVTLSCFNDAAGNTLYEYMAQAKTQH